MTDEAFKTLCLKLKQQRAEQGPPCSNCGKPILEPIRTMGKRPYTRGWCRGCYLAYFRERWAKKKQIKEAIQ